MLDRLSLGVRVFLFFAALGAGVLLAIGLGLGYRRLSDPQILPAFIQGGVVAGFVALGLVAWVWFLFDVNVAKPIDVLSGALRARAHADVTSEMDVAIARYLGDLAPAATAQRLAETRSALAESVMRETQRLGITIPEADRHTAIGDTVATADAFLKLMPMLQGRGLATFGDVLTEVRKHGRLLKDLN